MGNFIMRKKEIQILNLNTVVGQFVCSVHRSHSREHVDIPDIVRDRD